ncbi:MAG: ATP-binding protein [Nitrosomonas sp.]|nr:ATP-binding protein [Nitrosomonas sp.]
MGRLFWKFFIFFWLAQITTFIGVGVAMWLRSPGMEQLRAPPPSGVAAAALTLRYGGREALRGLLREQSREPAPPVFAVDENNRDILGRSVSEAMLAQASQIAGSQNNFGRAEKVTDADGYAYLLFAPSLGYPGLDRRMEPPPHDRGMLPPVMPLLAGGVVSLFFAAWLAWYFSKPIRTLRAAFAAVSNGLLDVRLAPVMGNRRDELSDLGRDFDSMVQRLQQLMDGQRRVLHDVSHELRSPLARLQAAIGLARQQPERTEDSMMRIEREAVRMDILVSELLTLSRLEADMIGKLNEQVDLNELVSNVVEDARFEAAASGCRVEFEARSGAIVRGNAELLHRAVENVVRNAVKHSPSGGLIGIKIRINSDQTIFIYVLDEGTGVPEADIQSIFEPFFRSDKKKTSDGHGLGLAIAKRVITAHQGEIYASNRPSGGLCIIITLLVGLAA